MPVIIKIAAHEANIIPQTDNGGVINPVEIVNHVLRDTGNDAKRLVSSLLPPIRSHIQSSFRDTTA